MVTPVTGVLRAVWGDSDDNVWAVGDHGVVLSFDGESWGEVATCSSIGSTDLYDVHGGGGRVYALGGGHLWRIAPAPCSHVREFYCGMLVSDPCTTARALWVSPQGDYCVPVSYTWHIGLGEWEGVVIGLHGTSTNSTGNRDVWGATEDDIYAPGYGYGTETPVFHYDGTGWVEISPPVTLRRISGSSATEVFGLGGSGYVLALYNGNAWTLTEPHGINGRLWGSSSDDIHIVWGSDIAHWNGVEYTYFMPEVPTLLKSFSCAPTESGIEVVWELSETGVGMQFVVLRAVGKGNEVRIRRSKGRYSVWDTISRGCCMA